MDSLPPESHGYCLNAKSCLTLLGPHGLQPARLFSQWNFPRKNTRVGCLSFSRRSSWPRDWTCVSCIVGGFFTAELPGKPTWLCVVSFFFFKKSLCFHVYFLIFSWWWQVLTICISFSVNLRFESFAFCVVKNWKLGQRVVWSFFLSLWEVIALEMSCLCRVGSGHTRQSNSVVWGGGTGCQFKQLHLEELETELGDVSHQPVARWWTPQKGCGSPGGRWVYLVGSTPYGLSHISAG